MEQMGHTATTGSDVGPEAVLVKVESPKDWDDPGRVVGSRIVGRGGVRRFSRGSCAVAD